MTFRRPAVDYRQFRPSRLDTDQFRHLKLLFYWPLFGLLFWYAERGVEVEEYHVMYCALDEYIPFCEWFLIPYLFWFVFLVGMHVYTLLYDVPAFRRMMYFIILTYSAALIIFFIFPNTQHLRPEEFPRDNALTRFLREFYRFDTNTNVCPSLHVVGSLAVLFASWDTRRFAAPGWRAFFLAAAVLISVSTVFLKQHSVVDLLVALPLCVAAWWLVYKRPMKSRAALPSSRRKRPERSAEL